LPGHVRRRRASAFELKGGVATEGHLFALRLLPVDLRQQEFLPAVRAVDVAGTQLGGQAVALAVEQQQRMITGGLEVAVVRTVLLPAMDPDFGAVHIQHDSPRRSDSFGPRD
jgi:hypothetical protein